MARKGWSGSPRHTESTSSGSGKAGAPRIGTGSPGPFASRVKTAGIGMSKPASPGGRGPRVGGGRDSEEG